MIRVSRLACPRRTGEPAPSCPLSSPVLRNGPRGSLTHEFQSIFPKRGQPDNDREYRHPRTRAEKPPPKRDTKRARRDGLDPAPVRPTPVRPVPTIDPFDYLPPREEIIDAVQMFTRHYFQLGFIPKQMFISRLEANQRDVSVFLLLALLSISARFTPSLVQRYGSGMKAADLFMDRASRVALDELYEEPNLERCQGFYLLAIAQQGSGFKNRSSVSGTRFCVSATRTG